MKEEHIYTGSKTQNQFTAYLMSFVRGRRQKYLDKYYYKISMEDSLREWEQMEKDIPLEEYLEVRRKEKLLMDEVRNKYPSWDEMSDKKLLAAILLLREDERKLIYQHVFEERGFEEMSQLNALSVDRIKGIYYYTIRKIRKWMGGDLR